MTQYSTATSLTNGVTTLSDMKTHFSTLLSTTQTFLQTTLPRVRTTLPSVTSTAQPVIFNTTRPEQFSKGTTTLRQLTIIATPTIAFSEHAIGNSNSFISTRSTTLALIPSFSEDEQLLPLTNTQSNEVSGPSSSVSGLERSTTPTDSINAVSSFVFTDITDHSYLDFNFVESTITEKLEKFSKISSDLSSRFLTTSHEFTKLHHSPEPTYTTSDIFTEDETTLLPSRWDTLNLERTFESTDTMNQMFSSIFVTDSTSLPTITSSLENSQTTTVRVEPSWIENSPALSEYLRMQVHTKQIISQTFLTYPATDNMASFIKSNYLSVPATESTTLSNGVDLLTTLTPNESNGVSAGYLTQTLSDFNTVFSSETSGISQASNFVISNSDYLFEEHQSTTLQLLPSTSLLTIAQSETNQSLNSELILIPNSGADRMKISDPVTLASESEDSMIKSVTPTSVLPLVPSPWLFYGTDTGVSRSEAYQSSLNLTHIDLSPMTAELISVHENSELSGTQSSFAYEASTSNSKLMRTFSEHFEQTPSLGSETVPFSGELTYTPNSLKRTTPIISMNDLQTLETSEYTYTPTLQLSNKRTLSDSIYTETLSDREQESSWTEHSMTPQFSKDHSIQDKQIHSKSYQSEEISSTQDDREHDTQMRIFSSVIMPFSTDDPATELWRTSTPGEPLSFATSIRETSPESTATVFLTSSVHMQGTEALADKNHFSNFKNYVENLSFIADKCASSPCQNHGVCIEGEDAYICNCGHCGCSNYQVGPNCEIGIGKCCYDQ